jgi:hypothetical protein
MIGKSGADEMQTCLTPELEDLLELLEPEPRELGVLMSEI